MRRLYVALLLPLLLLTQQSGLLHELTHTYYAGRATGAQISRDEQLPDAALCVTCHAFGQASHAATGSTSLFQAPPAAYLTALEPIYALLTASAPKPRSRGPPQASV